MDNPRMRFARAATGIAFAVAFGAFCLDVFSHIGTVEIASVGAVGVGWVVAVVVWVLCGLLNIVMTFMCKTMKEFRFMMGLLLLWLGVPVLIYGLILFTLTVTN
ncbi:MAG: hypothetical protein BroJett009_09160 [Armatimonadota bacterium]|nr:MAG: hypothetical protein BroJett009_09160 [Armatimonadota bacterium]